MSALRSRTEVCAPRLSSLVVSSKNQRSTRFSHELEVGGEVQDEARVREQPFLDRRGLVRGAVVEHEVDVEMRGDLAIEGLEELFELDCAVAGVQPADDLAGAQIQRGVEAGGARAPVVVGGALGNAREHRQDRRGPI